MDPLLIFENWREKVIKKIEVLPVVINFSLNSSRILRLLAFLYTKLLIIVTSGVMETHDAAFLIYDFVVVPEHPCCPSYSHY